MGGYSALLCAPLHTLACQTYSALAFERFPNRFWNDFGIRFWNGVWNRFWNRFWNSFPNVFTLSHPLSGGCCRPNVGKVSAGSAKFSCSSLHSYYKLRARSVQAPCALYASSMCAPCTHVHILCMLRTAF